MTYYEENNGKEYVNISLPVYNPMMREAGGFDPFDYDSDTNLRIPVRKRSSINNFDIMETPNYVNHNNNNSNKSNVSNLSNLSNLGNLSNLSNNSNYGNNLKCHNSIKISEKIKEPKIKEPKIQKPKKKLQLFSSDETHPTYLIVLNEQDFKKIRRALIYKLKKNMLIQNNIHIMLDTYDYRSKDNKVIFFNNDRKYKIVYKRYNLNDKSLYIPIEEYSKSYLDFKTRICTSIVESLGVKSIEFCHNEFTQTLLNIDVNSDVSQIKTRAKLSSEEKDNYSNNDVKLYNKGHCNFLFCEPDEFETKITELNSYIMDKLDFENDIELKNLIRSRLVGNLIEYDLKYEIDFMNSIEVDLVTSFMTNVNVGLNFKKMATQKLNINLHIKFYKYSELINNDNLRLNERCLQLLVNYNDDEDEDDDDDNKINDIASIFHKKMTQSEFSDMTDDKNEIKDSNSVHDIVPENNSENNTECHREINYELDEKYKSMKKEILKKKILMKKKSNLLYSFIDRYMEKKCDKVILNNYKMFKITDQKFLNGLIRNIKTMEDLSNNSFFITTISSVLFSAFLTFDDEGLIKAQKIYAWIINNNKEVEHIPQSLDEENTLTKCSNIRCDDPKCKTVIKPVVTIFSYIIRLYNDNNPDNILTYGLKNSEELSKVLRYISLNLKHITTYNMLTDFVNKHINMYRYKYENSFKDNCEIDTHGNIMIIYKKKLKNATSGFFEYMNNMFFS
jgi:hypothetical protein